MADQDIEYEYYRVRVAKSKKSGRQLSEEWYHDPDPRNDLKLHREWQPARTFYDPETSEVTFTQYCTMGTLDTTVKHTEPLGDFTGKPPWPEPKS